MNTYKLRKTDLQTMFEAHLILMCSYSEVSFLQKFEMIKIYTILSQKNNLLQEIAKKNLIVTTIHFTVFFEIKKLKIDFLEMRILEKLKMQ